MSNLLVVKSHPLSKEESRTLAVLDTFLTTYETTNPADTITVLDLYEDNVPEIDKDMLYGWAAAQKGEEMTPEQQAKTTRFTELTEQFLNSDKIIVANPLWNLNIPTKLKAWIDTITVSGKTFKYTATGPVGLTKNKKVVHIQSSGGVYDGHDTSSQFIKNIFNFVGVNDIDSIYIQGIDHHPEQSEQILADIHEIARQKAQTF